jgi:hypothetical protein
MERQWTVAKTPGAATIPWRTENRRVSPGRNASYKPILHKIKGYQFYHTVHPQNTATGGSAALVKDDVIHHEEAKYATDEIQATVVTKNAVFWDVAPCRSSGLNRRFGGTYRLYLQGRKIRERRTVFRTSVRMMIILIQSPSCPMSVLYSTVSAGYCPGTT